MPNCSSIQRSLAWCQGKPELPGVKRRIFYISKYDILQWPTLQHDENGRLLSAAYTGSFVLRADAKWKFIDIITDKSQLTSDAQGEYPSQTQLNKLVAVHPGVDAEASAASAYLNNNDNVFLVEDMRGAMRVVGSEKWPTKTTVTQDLGQGATGTTSTTINVEATDECPAPFYSGTIDTDDGTISAVSGGSSSSSGNGSSSGGSGSSSSGSGSSSGGSSAAVIPMYNSYVQINRTDYTVNKGDTINMDGPLVALEFIGTNLGYIGLDMEGSDRRTVKISDNKQEGSWSGYLGAPAVIRVVRAEGISGNIVTWFTINVGTSEDDSNASAEDVSVSFNNGASYNKHVEFNTGSDDLEEGDTLSLNVPLKSLKITGKNLTWLKVRDVTANTAYGMEVSSDKTSATWTGNIDGNKTVRIIIPNGNTGGTDDYEWFTFKINTTT